MEFAEFAKQRRRMCKSYDDCDDGCPIYTHFDNEKHCDINCLSEPTQAQEIVQKWAEENPVKTRKSVFLEQHPKARLGNGGVPTACMEEIYGISMNCLNRAISCVECWNTPISESEVD